MEVLRHSSTLPGLSTPFIHIKRTVYLRNILVSNVTLICILFRIINEHFEVDFV